uniref:Reverse transcriptase domain-containing protein n=1 Tax=Chromera velia CCMP2878 TaxID=1169474 RepID=A0A0G4GT04_9ALVE|eukprot:Cvel_23267.t1-p1 / transcript=Cvel_23267.t1 / gene=Cvel_23267 / organism=Chromera_velia_CCMP2878 / gene_product=Retrovirus-related Pol polyprotein from transposon, putative / transcript_product=Retrovirus-related Pol polyprotein from transposon, putative / location=Cvel_scaffold2379:183-1784(+) / protein_length=419 / sequence_SO=supercontig / SO=protein_coding / is_pseudo=false
MSAGHPRREEESHPAVPAQVASVQVKPRPWVSVLLFGKPASALLDSGSQVTFVDVGYLAAADVEMKSPSVGLVALGNNSVPCVGETIAEIAHPSDPGKTFEHPVLVAEGSGYDIVLGMDFLRWHPEVRYAFEKDRLQVGDLSEFGVWYDDGVEPTKVGSARASVPPDPGGKSTSKEGVKRGREQTDLPPVDLSAVPEEWKPQYLELLEEFSDIWSRERFDVGTLRLQGKPYYAKIPTNTDTPVRWSQDRVPYHRRDEVKKELNAIQEEGIIKPSQSPWAAPVVLVKKPDGSIRFCLDFRCLNEVTKRDLFPLPRIQETLDRLAGSSVFSALDYTSGYHQILLDPDDAEKTAFITPFRLFEFIRMPFGLVNAPAIFQRAMSMVLTALPRDIALVYVDDVIVFSRGHQQHLQDLREVFLLV